MSFAFVTNWLTAMLAAGFAATMIGGPWWVRAPVALLTGFSVMAALMRWNPRP